MATGSDRCGDPIDPNPQYTAPPYWLSPPVSYAPPQWTNPATHARPAQVIASAVLAYCTAGLLMVAAVIVFASASEVNNLNTNFGGPGASTAPLTALGLGNLLSAGLLITGAAMVTGGQRAGRGCLAIGCGICFVMAIVWLDVSGESTIFWVLIFVALSITTTALVSAHSVSRWLQTPR